MSGRNSPVYCVGASLLTLALSAPAWPQATGTGSQADAGPQTAAPDQATAPMLQEIVVTAQKRTELLQNVPMTVDALQGEQLKQLAIYDFQNISALSPGLVITNESSADQTIQVRGISFAQFSGATPGVTVYWNGAEIDPQASLRPMFDIAQIEVLRGAQGTLRGDTSPAGQITIATRRPDLDQFEADVQQTVGNLSTLNTQGGVSLPLVHHVLGLRLAGLYDRNDEDGVVDIANGQHNRTQTQAGRATLEFRPSDNFDATLTYQHENGRNTTYTEQLAGPGDGAQYPLTPNGPALTPKDMAAVFPGPSVYPHRLDEGVLNVRWSFAGQQLDYTGSYWDDENPFYLGLDHDNVVPNPPASAFTGTYTLPLTSTSAPAISESVPVESQRQYAQELRIESTGGVVWNYMFGVYYSHLSVRTNVFMGSDTANTTTTPGAVLQAPGADAVAVYIPETIATEALFTDQRFQLTSADLLEVGFRYSRYPQERQSTIYVGLTPAAFGVPAAYLPFYCPYVPGATYANGLCNLPPDQTIPASAASVTSIGRTGSLSFSHHFSPNLMSYFRYARAYRVGGPDVGETAPLPLQYETFQPESSNSYELGVKATLFNNREQIFGDVFYQQFHDFINSAGGLIYTATPNPSGTATCPAGAGSVCNVSITTNGPAIAEGFELSARTKFTDNLYTQLNVAYADAHYNDAALPCNDFTNSGYPNASGTPAVQPNRYISTCASSQPLSQVGRWQASANADYSHPLAAKMAWFVRGLVDFSSAPPNIQGSGYTLSSNATVDAFLGLRSNGTEHSWSGFLYARNLCDTRHYVINTNARVELGIPSGYYLVNSLPQRQYGVTLSYEY